MKIENWKKNVLVHFASNIETMAERKENFASFLSLKRSDKSIETTFQVEFIEAAAGEVEKTSFGFSQMHNSSIKQARPIENLLRFFCSLMNWSAGKA